jgi:hypothetical protein
MTAGITLGTDTFLFTFNEMDMLDDDELTFETTILESGSGTPRPTEPAPVKPETLHRQMLLGAAARADLRRAGSERYRTSGAKNVVAARGWGIALTADGSMQAGPGIEKGKVVSYAESFQSLKTLRQNDPRRAKSLMLVRLATQRGDL